MFLIYCSFFPLGFTAQLLLTFPSAFFFSLFFSPSLWWRRDNNISRNYVCTGMEYQNVISTSEADMIDTETETGTQRSN